MPLKVVLNCAMSLDGCIGLPGPKPLKLSDAHDARRVHELRARSDAILVGIGTVLADDPKLTVKWDLLGQRGTNPLRVILDARLRTPPGARVLDAQANTVVYHGKKGGALAGNAQLRAVSVDRHGFLDLGEVLRDLESLGVKTLMVEGGSTVISAFLQERLVEEWTLYVAPIVVGDPSAPRIFHGEAQGPLGLRLASAAAFGSGALLRLVRA